MVSLGRTDPSSRAPTPMQRHALRAADLPSSGFEKHSAINPLRKPQSALLELSEALRSADGGELMRRLLHTMLQTLIDAEATAHIGAGPHERTDTRTTQRNGTREKLVATTAGDLTVKIPKLRTGSFFPSLLAPRRRIDVALHAVVMQAWVEGVSIRKVDDLVAALGVESGISKSEVSRICAQLDGEVAAWRARPLDEQAFPYEPSWIWQRL